MRAVVVVTSAIWALHSAGSVPVAPRRAALLQLQRVSRSNVPPAFDNSAKNPAELNLQGFCKRTDCAKPPCEPVCKTQPCCCWSTFAAETHPSYPSPDEVKSKQQCLYPPEGFVYAPEPGSTYDDGYMSALKKANLPKYEGRRLCCLHRSAGVQDESQRGLRHAVKTSSTTLLPTTSAKGVPQPGQVNHLFTTKIPTTSVLKPGDEFENAQMEEAARAHLVAANHLSSAVSSLNASATVIEDVHKQLQTDPHLVKSRERVAHMRSAIKDWATRRGANLKKLATGNASSFDEGAAHASRTA